MEPVAHDGRNFGAGVEDALMVVGSDFAMGLTCASIPRFYTCDAIHPATMEYGTFALTKVRLSEASQLTLEKGTRLSKMHFMRIARTLDERIVIVHLQVAPVLRHHSNFCLTEIFCHPTD
jgi:hypothetical protein